MLSSLGSEFVSIQPAGETTRKLVGYNLEIVELKKTRTQHSSTQKPNLQMLNPQSSVLITQSRLTAGAAPSAFATSYNLQATRFPSVH